MTSLVEGDQQPGQEGLVDSLIWSSGDSGNEPPLHHTVEVIQVGNVQGFTEVVRLDLVQALAHWQTGLEALITTEALGDRLSFSSKSQWQWDITLLSNAEIQALNRDHRQQDKPTDVLSFPAWDLAIKPPKGLPEVSLGSIVISVEYGLTLEQPMPLLDYLLDRMTHGTLHLLGHHHDTMAEYEQVVAWQQQVLAHVHQAIASFNRAGHQGGMG